MRVLALDVGSSSTRAGAYDERGRQAAEPARRSYTSSEGQLDADELLRAAEAVLSEAGDADALGISCFWHSLLLLDELERPLTPVLLWQDRRATPCWPRPALPKKQPESRASGTACSCWTSATGR